MKKSKDTLLLELNKIAEQKGGKCLSKRYNNSTTKLLWECSQGHRWNAQPNNIKSGTWCPYCSGRLNGDINALHQIAKDRGGKCLSDKYINTNTKLLWECKKGHRWKAIPKNIIRGSWCPKCAGYEKGTLKDMNNIAEARGGKCLSEDYINSNSKLIWECSEGHKWNATPRDIKQGKWCPYCSGNIKFSIRKANQIAKKNGGKCLSKRYLNQNIKLLWECFKGHRWESTLRSVRNGAWCPKCSKERSALSKRKHTIDEMCKLAEARGGKCLSEKYFNPHAKLLWKCANGHQWEAGYNSVKRGLWCPICSSGLGERICREYFEQIFGKPFPRCYPKWLQSKLGFQMELDGYNEELCIAFEHHGEQHYSIDNPFIDTMDLLEKRKVDDNWKRHLCLKRNVLLIEIPQIPDRTPIHNIKDIIKREFENSDFQLPVTFDSIEIDLKKAYTTRLTDNELLNLKIIAANKGGKCLSNQYINNTTKLLWECTAGHRWYAAPSSVKNNTWCPICAGIVKSTIKEMRILADNKGGKCLSDEYINNNSKLLWECKFGHRWASTPKNIKKGKWCPHCAGVAKYNIEDMRFIAENKDGKCLSKSYTDIHTKLLWECSKGHQWEATPDSIKRGTWCPICGKGKSGASKKLNIEEANKIAKYNGGKCLSKNYDSARAKLSWKCSKDHQWEATLDSVKRGSWCPVCGRIKSGRSKRLGIEAMNVLAKNHDGKCLSTEYVNANTKLIWQCSEGHQWEALPNSIKRGSWCPTCSSRKKRGVQKN